MSTPPKIVTLTPDNYTELGCPCFLNPKQEGHQIKLEWLKKRFAKGFTIKHLMLENEKRPSGFIEYTPGEYAWRAVDANDYLVIHCIWINPNKYKQKGYGSLLIQEAIKDAQKQNTAGVAIVTSDGPFIASKNLFVKNGFELVAQDDRFELLVKQLRKAALPAFKDWRKQLSQYKGLNVVYSNQCPWVARSMTEFAALAKEKGLALKVTELKTAQEAQNAPSIYSTFTLINDGKTLADHYISTTRFLTILKKEKLIK
ncbi:MAG: GNAT family N-acetyltransferase [Candidatus Bathyarchaeota archaeon]|nr:GNAT family N-acetyltransferase [Candidatus Bathyarchaeota archaeon]